jgi:hypothetical protein
MIETTDTPSDAPVIATDTPSDAPDVDTTDSLDLEAPESDHSTATVDTDDTAEGTRTPNRTKQSCDRPTTRARLRNSRKSAGP